MKQSITKEEIRLSESASIGMGIVTKLVQQSGEFHQERQAALSLGR